MIKNRFVIQNTGQKKKIRLFYPQYGNVKSTVNCKRKTTDRDVRSFTENQMTAPKSNVNFDDQSR